jgi:uncharacterized membrane protein YbhN (UPF0104 family)
LQTPTAAVARTLRATLSWHNLAVAGSLVVILVSAAVLWHLLRDIDVGAVWTALSALRQRDVAMASLFALCTYATLTCYDYFALRAIGATQVPYRVAAFAGATSYAIGHGIGAMVLASAAVRFRLYSGFGLRALDVAKICFISGLTFWLGNIASLGLAMTIMPQAASAVDQLPTWVNRGIGIVLLCGLAAYIVYVWGGRCLVGRNGWQVKLPNGNMTLLQIAIGATDLGCCSLAMYFLMPDSPSVALGQVAVAVICGTLLGFASHSPGAIGALDAAILIAMPQLDPAALVATLLVYRLLCFVIPFVVAVMAMALREATEAWRG